VSPLFTSTSSGTSSRPESRISSTVEESSVSSCPNTGAFASKSGVVSSPSSTETKAGDSKSSIPEMGGRGGRAGRKRPGRKKERPTQEQGRKGRSQRMKRILRLDDGLSGGEEEWSGKKRK